MSFFIVVGSVVLSVFFFFQAEDGIRDADVTGVQTCALPISPEVAMAAFGAAPGHVVPFTPDPRHARLRGEPVALLSSVGAPGGLPSDRVRLRRRSEERRVGKECRSRLAPYP